LSLGEVYGGITNFVGVEISGVTYEGVSWEWEGVTSAGIQFGELSLGEVYGGITNFVGVEISGVTYEGVSWEWEGVTA